MVEYKRENGEPKVLIFCQCYNHEKYVVEAMESIVNQTYKNWEFFLVDDGSQDRTADIIEEYLTDDRITLVRLEKNTSGIGAGRVIDEYIRNNDAKYIAGMSSDDKWELDKLEKQIDFLENNPTYKACFTWDTIIFDEGADRVSLKEGYSHLPNNDRYKNLYRLIRYCNFYNAASFVEHRAVYLEIGGFNWAYRNLSDYDLWIRIQSRYPVYLMDKCLTYYRKHATNLSTTPTTFFRDRNETFAILTKFMMEIDDITFRQIFFRDFVYNDSYSFIDILAEKISMLMRHNDQVRKQIAFLLYMQNSSNRSLLNILETRFKIDMKLFHNMTGSYGMEFLLSTNKPEVTYEFNKLESLLDYIDSKNKNYAYLKALKSNALREYLIADYNINHNINGFSKVRKIVWSSQDDFVNFDKKMLVIGQEFASEYKNIVDKLQNLAYISVLPKKENMFIDGMYIEPEIDSNIERVMLFDKQEHRIMHLWEVDKEDISEIVFYGCCNGEYPVEDIIDNVSLAIKMYNLPAANDNLVENALKYLLRVKEL